MNNDYLFTSESVSEGHPDKVADQISDAILDAILTQDPKARVAAETLCNTGLIVLAGEITTTANIDYIGIARETLKNIGYTNADWGIDYKSCAVLVAYDKQSPDIKQGVDNGFDQGAGDQGLVFGYACDETPTFMPTPIYLAHQLMEQQAKLRKNGDLKWLRPDAKAQVTLRYVNGTPHSIDTIVLSTQHSSEIDLISLRNSVIDDIIKPILPEHLLKNDVKFLINPTGRFVIGGPQDDCGLTGRKIIVDTYGGSAPHGGGCFSGKDPSKVDRSGAYMARYVAKNIVSSGIAKKCLVQISYAIGVANPTSIMVDTFETGIISNEKIIELINDNFDLRPAAIIQELNLLRPIYQKTASYGHFGRNNLDFPWEQIGKLKNY